MTIRVLVADDQELVRTGFRMIIDAREDLAVVGEAADGHEAVAVAQRTAPDVVLMVVRMPNLDGIAATRTLVDARHPARILILTTFDLDEHVFAALRAGASGFMLKDVRAAELVDAIRVVARGEALLAPTVTRRLLDRFADALPAPEGPPPALEELTLRELEAAGQRVPLELTPSMYQVGDRLDIDAQTTIDQHQLGMTLTRFGIRTPATVTIRARLRPAASGDR